MVLQDNFWFDFLMNLWIEAVVCIPKNEKKMGEYLSFVIYRPRLLFTEYIKVWENQYTGLSFKIRIIYMYV